MDRIAAIATHLRGVIGELLAQGVDRLPSERDLADQLGVKRASLRRALERLHAEGQIVRVPGRGGGAFLTERLESGPVPVVLFESRSAKIERDVDGSQGVPALLAEQGFAHRTEVLDERVIPVPSSEIARRLDISTSAEVVSLVRLRRADGVPLSLERVFLAERRFPGLLSHSPIHSLYSLLASEYAAEVTDMEETIDAIGASRLVAQHLGVRAGSPVFVLRRIGFDRSGNPLETSVDIFRADRTRLRTGLVRRRPDEPKP